LTPDRCRDVDHGQSMAAPRQLPVTFIARDFSTGGIVRASVVFVSVAFASVASVSRQYCVLAGLVPAIYVFWKSMHV
jgi:hypothetical protein